MFTVFLSFKCFQSYDTEMLLKYENKYDDDDDNDDDDDD